MRDFRDGYRPPEFEKEHLWSYERLKERIAAACGAETFRTGLSSFADLPEEMMVGKFGSKAIECVHASASDGKERATVLRFNPVKGVPEIQRGLFTGTESDVQMTFRYQQTKDEKEFWEGRGRLPLDKQMGVLRAQQTIRAHVGNLDVHRSLRSNSPIGRAIRQLYPRWIGTVHSHPADTSFSPVDITGFLTSPSRLVDVVGTKGGEIHVMVATSDTEWIPETEREERVGRWNKMIDQRVLDAVRTPEHRLRDTALVHRDAVRAFVRSMANKYKFGYYVGDNIGLLERVK